MAYGLLFTAVLSLMGVYSVCSLSETDLETYPSPKPSIFSCRKLKCPPGFSTLCDESGESRCERCVEGTFSQNPSRRECRPCARCRDDQFELQPCTSTSNVICKECSKCDPGFGVLKPCERTRDTICEKCPPVAEDGVISYPNIECNRGGSEDPDLTADLIFGKSNEKEKPKDSMTIIEVERPWPDVKKDPKHQLKLTVDEKHGTTIVSSRGFPSVNPTPSSSFSTKSNSAATQRTPFPSDSVGSVSPSEVASSKSITVVLGKSIGPSLTPAIPTERPSPPKVQRTKATEKPEFHINTEEPPSDGIQGDEPHVARHTRRNILQNSTTSLNPRELAPSVSPGTENRFDLVPRGHGMVEENSTLQSGARAVNLRKECVMEEIEMPCPIFLPASIDFQLDWMIADFQVKIPSKPYWISLGRCNETDCKRKKNIGGFDKRIKIRNLDRGTLFVKQLILHDQLTYKCKVRRRNNLAPLVNVVNVTSSKSCLSTTAGESLDLSQPFRGTFFKETVEDMFWYRNLKDGSKESVAYCNPPLPCILETCNNSCPEYLTRLKTNGMSMILTNVKQADRGLEFQCQIYPKKPIEKSQVYIIRINEIMPRADYVNGTRLTTATSTIKETRGTEVNVLVNVGVGGHIMPTPSPTNNNISSSLTSRPSLWAAVTMAIIIVAVLALIGVNRWRHFKETKGFLFNCPRPKYRPPRCTGSSDCCDSTSLSSAAEVYAEQNEKWPVQVTIYNDDSLPNSNNTTQHTYLPSERTLVVADVHHKTVFDLFNIREQLDGTTRSYPEYITQVEAALNSSGGKVCAPDSNVRIIVDSGTVPEGINQPFFFRVVYDETLLLRDIPETPDRALISPVIQCGPEDIKLLKPVEVVVPHCLYLDEVKKEWITVYRCAHYSDEGPINWEKVPSASEKNGQSKAWFTVKKDSIHIKTKVFSFWSVFVCGSSSKVIKKKKIGTVFFNRPNPKSDLIYLRFYIYSDNEDSKKRVEAKDSKRFPGSKAAKEKPFNMYNDENDITVKLTDLEGWQLDKTDSIQTYPYERAYRNGFRSKDSCDFAVKPTRQGVDEFSCNLRFQQEDHPPELTIYLNPGFTPRQTIRRFSVESTGSETHSNNNNNSSATGAGSISVVPEETEPECSEGQENEPSTVSLDTVIEDCTHDHCSSLGSGNEPVTERHCRCIYQQVGGNWKDVLRKLSIAEVTIERLDEDYCGKVAEKFYQGLLAWSRGTQRATTKTLCEALRLAGCSEALETLSREGVTSVDASAPMTCV